MDVHFICTDNNRRAMQIGLNQDDKNNKSRTNDDKSSSSMAKSLNDVFGFGGQSGGFGNHHDSFLDNSEDGVDDAAYGKDALIEAAMDLNYEMVNFMNNNSPGGGGFDKFPLTSMTPIPTPPMLTDDMAGGGAVGDSTPFSSTQSSSAVFDTWPTVGGGQFKSNSQQNQIASIHGTTQSSKDKLGVDSSPAVPDDLLKIEYVKPKVNLVISHCIRLPSILNDVAFAVHSIVPSIDGVHVFIVVNRCVPASTSTSTAKISSTQIYSAILVYPLTFNGAGVGVQERPLRQCLYDHDVGTIKNIVVLPKDAFNGGVGQKFENIVVLTEKGEILIVDVENGRIITRTTESFEEKLKFSSITFVAGTKSNESHFQRVQRRLN